MTESKKGSNEQKTRKELCIEIESLREKIESIEKTLQELKNLIDINAKIQELDLSIKELKITSCKLNHPGNE